MINIKSYKTIKSKLIEKTHFLKYLYYDYLDYVEERLNELDMYSTLDPAENEDIKYYDMFKHRRHTK